MNKEITLTLDGTAALFPCHIGGYKYLEDNNIKIKRIVSTSGGSIVGGMIASGYNFESIKTILSEIDFNNILDFEWNPINIWKKRGFYKGNKIQKELKKYIPYTFSELKIPLTIITCELNSRQGIYCNKENTPNMYVADAIRKSISIPGFFQPVQENNNIFVDGGIYNNYAIDYFPDKKESLGLKTVSTFNEGKKIKSLKDFIMAVIEVLIGSIENEHIEDTKFAYTILINSHHNRLDFNLTPEIINTMIADGYNSVRKNFPVW